jgi:hypothetical protein
VGSLAKPFAAERIASASVKGNTAGGDAKSQREVHSVHLVTVRI